MELIKIRSGIIASRVKERIDKEKAWNKVRPVRKISRMQDTAEIRGYYDLTVESRILPSHPRK